MKRKIIVSLLAIFTLFIIGAGVSLLYITGITSELYHVIELQQVEHLRSRLSSNIQAVQSNLYALNTPYADDTGAIIRNVAMLESSAQQCSGCHHPPGLSDRITGLQSLVKDYETFVSFYITTSANADRLKKIKEDAVNVGSRLLSSLEQMTHNASARINDEKSYAMAEMRGVRTTLIGTVMGTFVLGIIVAVILTRSVTRPVQEFVKATRLIASGQLGSTISYEGNTEFRELSEHFNYMSRAIKEGYEKITREIEERNAAEEALAKSEKFLSTVFESIRDPFCILDRDHTIIKANEAYAAIRDKTADEIAGKKCHEVIHNKNTPCSDCIVSTTFMSQDPCAKDMLGTKSDGSPFYAEIYTYPVFNDKGDVSHVIECTRDITDRKRTEEKLKKSEERYALAARGANDGLWDWDLESDLVYYSARWKSMLGYGESEVTGSPEEWLGRVHPDERVRVEMEISSHINDPSAYFMSEHRIMHKDGTYRWVLSRGLSVCDNSSMAYRMVGSMTDITERKSVEEQLAFDALHDSLTGLPNRALFMDRLGHAVIREKRNNKYLFAVLFLDIDRFKVLNDSMGHTVGDMLLVAVSKRLEESIRPGDTVARFGGDEFAILLEDLSSKNEVIFVAERIQEKLSGPFTVHDQEIFASASVGIAFSTTGYEEPEHLLRNADIAMYHAKSRNDSAGFKVFDTAMYASAVARLQIETELRQAINHDQFVLHYQPIISMHDGSIKSVEALIRWQHPFQGLVLPGEFINTAEETGLIAQIGEWVICEACRQLAEWKKYISAGHSMSMSVNISSKQLLPRLGSLISRVLHENGLGPEMLVLEITESMLMENAEQVSPLLRTLKDMNVKLHIDDFGTGYSSLGYLHKFPVDVLKIDRSFVSKIETNEDNLKIVRAIISLAHNLNMDVIAEGVETESQLLKLRELDCGYMQGYLFSKPLSAQDIEGLLRKGRVDLITLYTRTSLKG